MNITPEEFRFVIEDITSDLIQMLIERENYTLTQAKIVKFELGVKLIDLIHQYRFRQVTEYVTANPDEPLEKVALRFGYSSYSSLWRFMQRIGGVTPDGRKSNAGPELWLVWREEAKARRRR